MLEVKRGGRRGVETGGDAVAVQEAEVAREGMRLEGKEKKMKKQRLGRDQDKRTRGRATWYNFQRLKLIKTLSKLNTPKYWARNGWNEEAWEIVQKHMKDSEYCFDYSIRQIKYQERALKRQYETVKKLIRLNGFHWDKSRRRVIAQDDLWQQLLVSDKRAAKWRRMQFPLYEELCKFYEGTDPKQTGSQCANLVSKQSSMCSNAPPRSVNSSYEESSDSIKYEVEILKIILLEDVTSRLMIEKVKPFTGMKAQKTQKDSREKKYSISECMKALNASSGFAQQERFKAADFLKGRISHDLLSK
ncbi:hypothetical protein LUZ63_015454 [Rhynchospora breviuscula]|uniref:Myb/SANT-like domain-containing protein n=1 Tax=Rhynchospora breviuscula TaxID=2022672 RepID=A0A9Q0CCB8_9POAL|nr:hypothetical protein LUZ63_015454 [Rhynchospora breviuscula]